MKILVFGNADFEPDSLPLRLLPDLRLRYPSIEFQPLDPNEEWDVSGQVLAIDTVINLEEPRVFESLDAFEQSPTVSMHDFDALGQLRLLKKLGRIDSVKILGLPPDMESDQAMKWLSKNIA